MLTRIYGILIAMALLVAAHAAAYGVSKRTDGEFVVVVDAGHGGADGGAVGSMTNEKSINLAVARRLSELLKGEKGYKVVMTRPDDKFVTLQGRADIANRAGGDLFVSIHTNSVDLNSKNRSSVHGASVYVLGLDRTADNLTVAMRENSVMKLERDYSTTYQGFDPQSAESYIIFELNQNKYMRRSLDAARSVVTRLASTAGRKNNGVRQANFWVLLKTAMPAMLVELDFICNPVEEKFMASADGQEKLARAIYQGIVDYRNGLEGKTSGYRKPTATDAPSSNPSAEQSQPAAAESPMESADKPVVSYKIQFLSSPKRLRQGCSEFKGLQPVECYTEGGTHKYTYGNYASPREAGADLRRIRESFADAFVIKTVGGRRVP